MAEGFLRAMAESSPEAGDLVIGSAGVGAFEGQAPSQHSVTVMTQEGIDITDQRSRQLTPELIREASHIFGMATSHRQAIQALFPEAIEKTFVLREFIVEDELDLDVPDPIGMDLSAYEGTRNLVKEAIPSILTFLLWEPASDLLADEAEDDPDHDALSST